MLLFSVYCFSFTFIHPGFPFTPVADIHLDQNAGNQSENKCIFPQNYESYI